MRGKSSPKKNPRRTASKVKVPGNAKTESGKRKLSEEASIPAKRVALNKMGDNAKSPVAGAGSSQVNEAEPTPGSSNMCTGSEVTLDSVLTRLLSEIGAVKTTMTEKIDSVQATITQEVVEQVSQRILETVTVAVHEIVDEKLSQVRLDIDKDIQRLEKTIEEIKSERASNSAGAGHGDLALNVVIVGLKEGQNEKAENMVNALLRDGLKIRDVAVASAERKKSRKPGKLGVIIAKFKSKEDKEKVMKVKSKLKDNADLRSVVIFHDRPLEERIMEQNLKMITGCTANGKLKLRGRKVVRCTNRPNQEDNA